MRRRLSFARAVVVASLLLVPLTGCGATQTYQLQDVESFGSADHLPGFITVGAWDLQYSYDCSGHDAKGGFAITLYNKDDDSLIEENPDTIDTGAKTGQKLSSKTVHYHQSCTCYMSISSGCSWRVQVKVQQ